MPQIWNLIDLDTRDSLAKYQRFRHHKKLTPPDYQPVKGVIESSEEIGQLMRQAPSRSRE